MRASRVLLILHILSSALQVLQTSGIPGRFAFATNLTSPYVSDTGNYTCELQEWLGGTTTSAMQPLTVYGGHLCTIVNYDYAALLKRSISFALVSNFKRWVSTFHFPVAGRPGDVTNIPLNS